jgi:distribution and morphology protein 31
MDIGWHVSTTSLIYVHPNVFDILPSTTFFSAIIWTLNSLKLQSKFILVRPGAKLIGVGLLGFLARSLSNYLTHETGISIVFESAIVPKWRGSSITFKNVFVSRRPALVTLPLSRAALSRRAGARFDVSHEYNFAHEEEEEALLSKALNDANYSMFDLNVDSIDITLSLTRWLDGKGIVKDAKIKGVRGVLGAFGLFVDTPCFGLKVTLW